MFGFDTPDVDTPDVDTPDVDTSYHRRASHKLELDWLCPKEFDNVAQIGMFD